MNKTLVKLLKAVFIFSLFTRKEKVGRNKVEQTADNVIVPTSRESIEGTRKAIKQIYKEKERKSPFYSN